MVAVAVAAAVAAAVKINVVDKEEEKDNNKNNKQNDSCIAYRRINSVFHSYHKKDLQSGTNRKIATYFV